MCHLTARTWDFGFMPDCSSCETRCVEFTAFATGNVKTVVPPAEGTTSAAIRFCDLFCIAVIVAGVKLGNA